MVDIEVGNMEVFEDAWYEAVRALAREKIAEVLGVPIGQVVSTSEGCDDDEAFHFRVGNRLFHVCYSNPTHIFAVEEYYCEKCAEWIPGNIWAEHIELYH